MYLRVILFLICFTTAMKAFGQDTLLLSTVKSNHYLWKMCKVYTANLKANNLDELPKNIKWELVDSTTTSISGNYTWLKTTIKNNTDTPSFFDFDIWYADSISAWALLNQNVQVYHTGPYTALSNWEYYEDPQIMAIYCLPGETRTLYFKLWSANGRALSIKDIYIKTRAETLQETLNNYRDYISHLEFNGFFLGAVGFAMVFFLFIYFKVNQKLFLLYTLYLLGATLYSILVKTMPYSFLSRISYIDYSLSYKLGEPIQYLFFAAYIAFGKELLDINKNYPTLKKLLDLFTAILLISGTLLILYNFYHLDFQLQIKAFMLSRAIILPLSIIGLIWIGIKVQNPIKWFFLLGSSFFILGGLLAIIVDPKTRQFFWGDLGINPVISFKTGIIIESICFALALGYKIRQTQEAKEQASNDYIRQLELNHQMADSETERLEHMVQERTTELIEKQQQIENQKQHQLRFDYEKKLAEMEMTALRSQMNPHFIFNSLNSIRYQIQSENYETASNYLTRFAKLLRYILQNSREHIVNLDEEIEMNRLYLQLESLRFSQGFEYHFNIPEDIDISEIVVPPMLLQPYIENAVKHGLVPSKKAFKRLDISISQHSHGYSIVIEDNGIGRSMASTHSKLDDKQSLGMIISDERIALFNDHFQIKIKVMVTDLFENEIASGTRITFHYKPDNYVHNNIN